MLQPENQSKKYDHLFTDIEVGRIKIPKFQRDFVWSKNKTAKLIDSILKGFPIGTFIFWKTTEELRHIKNIGNANLPDTPKGESVSYVLDGQQRITSLYAVKKGLRITKDGDEIDYKDIYIDLSFDTDTNNDVVIFDKNDATEKISVHTLLNANITDFIDKYSKDEINKIDTYKKRLTGYDFSTIVISEYPIDIACEVFTRINTGGQELTLFEIMVAKTYDEGRRFDLAEKFEQLLYGKNGSKSLSDAGFDTIPPSVVLQCVTGVLAQQVRRQDILKLNKNSFISNWDRVCSGIFSSVDFIRTYLRIPVSRLLPYYPILVSFSYFFTINDTPTDWQKRRLSQYFWWASLSNRFTSGTEGKIALDLKKMDHIINNEQPSYLGEEVQLTLENLRWKWFSTGDAFCKAILCLYAYFEPKSFESNSIVKLDNSWLKVSTSKNYHHFFPRSYLRKLGFEDWKANSILNITLVDDHLNKRVIGSKAPGTYMKSFKKTNHVLQNTMKTHLIEDMTAYGVWDNDYEKFISARGAFVLAELNKRLNP